MLPRPSVSLLSRSFSTTARVCRATSLVGRELIPIPPSVTLDLQTPERITVTGPLGQTAVPLKPYIRLELPTPNALSVSVEEAAIKEQKQMWGTTRTLINNAVVGMTEGYRVPLYLVGVGYRAALEEDPRGIKDENGNTSKRLTLKVGRSHDVHVPIPPHIKAEVPNATKIVLFCTDKHQLGLFAAKVRSWRKPEPYKGKGIFIGNETIRIKSVKKK